ncbi:hypothetical protein AYK24_00415 [Thermoplasmatales archaeon SG8-52-4]|nr:MAG: hypothetical protein AYK24_00415 [Thermoplasmatales archaeon SG8-52-4]
MAKKKPAIPEFEIEIDNVLSLNSGEPDFMENTENSLKIKNAVIISMGWNPDNHWQRFLWGMLKHTLIRTHHEYFERADKYYESKS